MMAAFNVPGGGCPLATSPCQVGAWALASSRTTRAAACVAGTRYFRRSLTGSSRSNLDIGFRPETWRSSAKVQPFDRVEYHLRTAFVRIARGRDDIQVANISAPVGELH